MKLSPEGTCVGDRDEIYISDLDGTLLNDGARLSEFARSHLVRLLAERVRFTVATARSAQAVRSIFGDLVLHIPIIEQNGACVTDLATGQRLVTHTLEPEVALIVLREFEAFAADPIVACALPEGDRVFFNLLTNDGARWFIDEKRAANDPRLAETQDLTTCAATGVLSITTLASVETVQRLANSLRAALGSRVQIRLGSNTYTQGYWELSVLNRSATKAQGILTLRRALGLEHARLVVFGDAENDLDMFQHADFRIAVRNAVPELLALADHVVEANHQDGVIRWLIERFSSYA
ncbi:MAG: HAD-IIB family hydrolase [Myxococcota bacterium]